MNEAVTLIGGILGLAGLLGGAFVVWRSAGRAQAVQLWREEAEVQRTRAERMERAIDELTKRVEHLEAENTILRSVVTSKKEIEELTIQSREAHIEIMTALARLEAVSAARN